MDSYSVLHDYITTSALIVQSHDDRGVGALIVKEMVVTDGCIILINPAEVAIKRDYGKL